MIGKKKKTRTEPFKMSWQEIFSTYFYFVVKQTIGFLFLKTNKTWVHHIREGWLGKRTHTFNTNLWLLARRVSGDIRVQHERRFLVRRRFSSLRLEKPVHFHHRITISWWLRNVYPEEKKYSMFFSSRWWTKINRTCNMSLIARIISSDFFDFKGTANNFRVNVCTATKKIPILFLPQGKNPF